MPKPVTETYLIACVIVRDYRCARCHGPLTLEHIGTGGEGMCQIHCADPDCTGEGFVTKAWVDKLRSEQEANYLTAYANLHKVLGIGSGKTTDQLISELGY